MILLTNRGIDRSDLGAPNGDTGLEDASQDGQFGIPAPLPNEPVQVLNDRTIEERVGAKQAARIFVERFGTYSNQNDNEHIALTRLLATPSMQEWIKTREVVQGGDFIGVTTEVLASSISTLTDTSAEILIQVREIRESQTGIDTTLKNGRVVLELSESGVWLVGGLYYER